MFFCHLFLALSSLNFLHRFHVSTCDFNCTDKPTFTPSSLVVKFGDPAAANCSVCQHACHNRLSGLEKSVGKSISNGTAILWTTDQMVEWSTKIFCYYHKDGGHCCAALPVTVYRPPTNVLMSIKSPEPIVEGDQYTLECTVLDVAPIENVLVTFFKGQTSLIQQGSLMKTNKPVNWTFSHSIVASREDDGVEHWCQTKLELGPEGPQYAPVVSSQSHNVTVLYKPKLKGPSPPDALTVMAGDPLQLSCSAEGNPRPSYSWTLPSADLLSSNSSILTVQSVTVEHKGQYVCFVSNGIGNITVHFHVDVQVNYTYIIVAVVLVVAALTALFFAIVFAHRYKHNRMGQYNLKDVFRFRTQHVALTTGD